MMKAAQALSAWFEQFGLPVYLETDVPDEAELPYITIPLREPEWDAQASFAFTIWYRTKSNLAMIQKADQIVGAIRDGTRIYFDGGLLVLRMDTTPVQVIVNNDYRGAYISAVMNSYHMPGE